MSDQHEQPEYGERATPEQQAEAIRRSGGVPEAQRAAELPRASWRAADGVQQRPATGASASTRPGTPPSGSYLVNRFVTVFLLGVGLVAVIQSVFSSLNLAESIQILYAQQGIGDYVETPLTSTVGIALVIVHAALWAATAWVSMKVLAAGRTAWWIPLLGAVIAFVVMAILMAVLILGDPAFMQYIGSGG
ncbi:MAG: hypothetical protein KF680_00400 [Cryobacterium sp.]|nr:hypothetical protein [Cryobacterium sp.]